jgi:hypothetical protein
MERSGIAIVSTANTTVAFLISGASISVIVAAISGNAVATVRSFEALNARIPELARMRE